MSEKIVLFGHQMIERGAKAAYESLFTDSEWPETNCSIDADGFRKAARACIEAALIPEEKWVMK